MLASERGGARAGALVVSLLCCSCASSDSDFSGYWEGFVDGSRATMSLTQQGQDVAGRMDDMALVGRVDGDSLSFSLTGAGFSCAVNATGSGSMASLTDRDQVQLSYFGGYSCGGAFNGSGTFDRLRCPAGTLACHAPYAADWVPYCADGQTDAANCGQCGLTCGEFEVCAGGECRSAACTGPVPLQAPRVYQASYAPTSLLLADVTGDGFLDAVVPDQVNFSLAVLPGTAGGGFAAPVVTALDSRPVAAAIGDLDGDDRLDLVAYAPSAWGSEGAILVLLGNGDGSFETGQSLPIGAYEDPPLRPMALADFDGDGALDLATRIGDVPVVQVRLGVGDGSFGAARDLDVSRAPSALVASDLDGDGKVDLAIAYRQPSWEGWEPPQIGVLLGNGDGSFRPPTGFTGVHAPVDIAVGDFDGNGNPDLAVTGYSSYVSTPGGSFEYPAVAMLPGRGGGAFASPVGIVTGPNEWRLGITVTDLDGDGHQDVALTGGNDGLVELVLGSGGGTFASHVRFPVKGDVSAIAAADLDGDGAMDVVVANGWDTVRVFLACPR